MALRAKKPSPEELEMLAALLSEAQDPAYAYADPGPYLEQEVQDTPRIGLQPSRIPTGDTSGLQDSMLKAASIYGKGGNSTAGLTEGGGSNWIDPDTGNMWGGGSSNWINPDTGSAWGGGGAASDGFGGWGSAGDWGFGSGASGGSGGGGGFTSAGGGAGMGVGALSSLITSQNKDNKAPITTSLAPYAAQMGPYGQLAAALMTAKGYTAGSDPKKPKGVLNTLMMPSIDEWIDDPKRSATVSLNPGATALGDAVGNKTFSKVLNPLKWFG